MLDRGLEELGVRIGMAGEGEARTRVRVHAGRWGDVLCVPQVKKKNMLGYARALLGRIERVV